MNLDSFPAWLPWAALSAVFAALTAIFAKIGVEDINSDLATLIRTVIVLISLALILFATVGMGLGFSAVVIGHVTFSFPFVLVAVQARLKGLDPAMEEAALDLGATPLQAFLLVIVPCLRPAIVAGALMAFTLSWDELIVTFFTTNAASATLPIRVFGMAKVGLNPMLNALSAIFILATAAFVLFSNYLKKLSR